MAKLLTKIKLGLLMLMLLAGVSSCTQQCYDCERALFCCDCERIYGGDTSIIHECFETPSARDERAGSLTRYQYYSCASTDSLVPGEYEELCVKKKDGDLWVNIRYKNGFVCEEQ